MRRSLRELSGPLDGITLISTDVFDTLLLRTRKSERSRIVEGERLFARLLGQRGFRVSADHLVELRLQAQKLAFRALSMAGTNGEVRLADIIARQLRLLGLPEELTGERLKIEIAIEKTSLRPNAPFGEILGRLKRAGMRIVAISDIGLPADKIAELIDHCHGPGMVDRVYSSADEGATKRHGDLFQLVLAAERGVSPAQWLHIGDDETADSRIPSALGINTIHLPRGRLKPYASRADGAVTELGRQVRRRVRLRETPLSTPQDAVAFGREVLGPIVAEFCFRIWLYADQAGAGGDAALLFCARGGVGIREAFERVLGRLGLPLAVRRDTIMISRLVAARSAVMEQSAAALEELGREFRDNSFSEVAEALGGRSYDLPENWRERFAPEHLFPRLAGIEGQEILADIAQQNALFARHMAQISGGARRIILCDTGLYGSTQRLLAAGFPHLSIETLQFARSNYKGHGEEHFPRVVGLVVEQNLYNPLRVETTILRYWQLIERLFEPAIPSVRLFQTDEAGEVVANCGSIRYGDLDPSAGNPLLTGALQYIDALSGCGVALDDAARAWPCLKRAITRPSEADVRALDVGMRSVDFGRAGAVRALSGSRQSNPLAQLAAIKSQLWREGAIAREFPRLKPALFAMLEAAHAVRGLSARLHR